MINFLLRIRYKFFKKWLKTRDFSSQELIFEDHFKSLDNFEVSDKDFYNNNSVWFSKEAVQLTDEGLLIKCYKDKSTHTSWQGTRETNWTSGMVCTSGHFVQSNGTWVIRAKICGSWPAIWLLKVDRKVVGYTKEQIIPEIDIMEVIHGKILQTVHYGYSDKVYRRTAKSATICKNDNQFHDFAVEFIPKGYNFYIDGILTAKHISDDPELVSNRINYLILNNAALPGDNEENYNFIVNFVKVYK